MASTMRNVRRRLRQELLEAIRKGDGNLSNLIKIAGCLLGQYVGYEILIKNLERSEVNLATSQLRVDGHVESIGKVWKAMEALESQDVDIVSIRRLKRMRGELKAQIRLAHDHGRI